jgi:2-hydroxy-3-oxopropionate reductase
MSQSKIGFIGLGIMGKPMARNLMKAGFPLVVHNRSRGKVDELAKEGATPAGSPKELAAAVDVVITMLPNSPDVELVALGPNGIKEGAKTGQLFIDMSTINPIVSQKIAKELSSVGVPIPTAAFVEQLFSALRVRGRGGLDHSGVITLFEDLAGVQVRRS